MTLDLHNNHQLEAEVAEEQNKKINRIILKVKEMIP
jgi:hypothetical protein